MGCWQEDPTAKFGLRCTFHPKCPFCKTPLRVLTTNLLDFKLDEEQEINSHALDVDFMCPACGYLDIFGVAISEEHWGRILKLLADLMEKEEAVYLGDVEEIRGEKNVVHGVSVKHTPLWERTYNIEAHKPKFEVKCFHCGEDMTLRHTTLHYHDDGSHEYELNQACYKCARCGWFIRFNIIDEVSYLKEIHTKFRKDIIHHPPVEEWSEDKEKERQLKSLGYWGGR